MQVRGLGVDDDLAVGRDLEHERPGERLGSTVDRVRLAPQHAGAHRQDGQAAGQRQDQDEGAHGTDAPALLGRGRSGHRPNSE